MEAALIGCSGFVYNVTGWQCFKVVLNSVGSAFAVGGISSQIVCLSGFQAADMAYKLAFSVFINGFAIVDIRMR